MTKYEVFTDTFEFRFGTYKESIPSMDVSDIWMEYNCQSCYDPECVASFDTLEEALAYFRENYDDYGRTWAEKGNVFWLLRGQMAWIDRNEYDDEGNFVDGGDLYECSAEGYIRDGKVINGYGVEIDFDTAVELMDDDLRDKLSAKFSDRFERQEFFDAYADAHAEAFGETWELAKRNPVY